MCGTRHKKSTCSLQGVHSPLWFKSAVVDTSCPRLKWDEIHSGELFICRVATQNPKGANANKEWVCRNLNQSTLNPFLLLLQLLQGLYLHQVYASMFHVMTGTARSTPGTYDCISAVPARVADVSIPSTRRQACTKRQTRRQRPSFSKRLVNALIWTCTPLNHFNSFLQESRRSNKLSQETHVSILIYFLDFIRRASLCAWCSLRGGRSEIRLKLARIQCLAQRHFSRLGARYTVGLEPS